MISGILHQDVGPAVPQAALDLRPAELAAVVPLVLCLVALSAWPNAISGHSFGGDQAKQQIASFAEGSAGGAQSVGAYTR